MSQVAWYYGNINRVKAEKLLLASQNKDGSFLVRISESHSDEYTVSGRWHHPHIYPLIHSSTHSSTHPFIHTFIHLPTDSQQFTSLLSFLFLSSLY
uniref:SH2 domain-containing protein n=1 Tax=Gasterosteus aculeatus aculeatus TaxID=481459 RepID=A0AAQ4QR50_GASAC